MLILNPKLQPRENGGAFIFLRKGRAVLASPLDIQPYYLEIPRLKKQYREGAIRYQLRSRYPASPGETELDFVALPRRGHAGSSLGLLVFAASPAASAAYRGLKKPLVPGMALMRRALGTMPEGLVILQTPEWVEAARFEKRRPVWRRADPWRPDSPGLPFLDQACKPGETGSLLVIAIAEAGPLTEELGKIFKKLRVCTIREVEKKLKISRDAIFSEKAPQSIRPHRLGLSLLILLNLGSLLFSLGKVQAQNEAALDRSRRALAEKRAAAEEAAALRQSIAAYQDSQGAGETQGLNHYACIAALQSCLGEARIVSLLIRDQTFTVEAEGADAMLTLRALEEAPEFSTPLLRQASASPGGLEVFTISGGITGDIK
jgi:hypothetical protein